VILHNRVRVGAGNLDLPPPALLPPASVIYFSDELADEETGEVTDQARDAYRWPASLPPWRSSAVPSRTRTRFTPHPPPFTGEGRLSPT
jgi:hypothetical protein